jgi:very-short-patch-repair endonuclease
VTLSPAEVVRAVNARRRQLRPDYAAALIGQCRLAGLPVPAREHRFWPGRRFAFDLAWPDRRLAVEIDGGVWTQGRHTRGKGYTRDCVKLAEAAIRGWSVIRVTTDQVTSGQAVEWVRRFLERHEAPEGAKE